jgi:hypothetical protein
VKHLLIILSLFLFSLIVISCRNSSKTATTDNETTNNELIGNNNNSILSGSRIGSGEDYNSNLSKSVRISVENYGVFSYQTPYCGRVSTETESFSCIIPIINLSKYPSCFISMRSIKYYDRSNNTLDDGLLDYSFVQGSIGVRDGTTTSTCLTSGETGYVSHGLNEGIVGVGWTPYTDLYKIVVSEIRYSSGEFFKISDPSIQIKPLSYSTSGKFTLFQGGSLTVTVKNYSEINILTRTSRIYFLDSYNRPVYSSSLNPQGSGNISSNSSKQFKLNNFWYTGSIYKIHVFINVGY